MNFERIFDILPYQLQKYPQQQALCMCQNGQILSYSTRQCLELINQLSCGLLQQGIQKNDTVAIMASQNCPEWSFTDFAIQQTGGITVPIHATASPDECLYIFNHAQIKWCFVNNKDLYSKIHRLHSQLPQLQAVFTFLPVDNATNWQQLLLPCTQPLLQTLQQRKKQVQPQDVATIIYTSGTTGQPKGVVLTHDNIVSNIKSILPVLPVAQGNPVLSFLPLSHVFERTANYTCMAAGAGIFYSAITQTEQNMRLVKPCYFSAVPRVLERMFEEVEKRAQGFTGFRKYLFQRALSIAEAYPFTGKPTWRYAINLYLARLLVLRRLKKAVGGRVKGIFLGAAALQPRLARIFTAAGIPVREGYGLTESAPVLAFNRFEPGGSLLGTVGIPIPGVEIKINPTDGEILARGPNIMKGYYLEPQLTAQTITPDGWLHTGDLGEWVNDKFLKITGRKKELFKITSGKYVAPQPIENQLRESAFIEHAMVIGDGHQFISALIAPAFGVLQKYCLANNLPVDAENTQNWLNHPAITALYRQLIDNYNSSPNTQHPIRKFLLLPHPFTPENGLLTPTLKVKREAVIQQYQQQIETLYQTWGKS
ncbi:long-chain fatty acid--CoA ligase [Sphingobacteriales bacterium UPWRP_1]|nr:hypothetical protein B6N25_06775 [Sphingobacteriales bacterium TSM_CSS]PSJ73363.1 long-chain fatty acid--CoA ligase [Sphingobacteriales bacterium UPWRP_1]